MKIELDQSRGKGAAIVLAAGLSERFGLDKRLLPFRGSTLLQYTVSLYAGVFERVLLVLHDGDLSLKELLPERVEVVFAARAREGMSQSIRAGVQRAILEPWIVVGLLDMPYIKVSTLELLALRMESTTAGIVRLQHQQQFGNPVGFKREYFSRLSHLTGDEGARTFVSSREVSVEALEVRDPGILLDIDTPEQLHSNERRISSGD